MKKLIILFTRLMMIVCLFSSFDSSKLKVYKSNSFEEIDFTNQNFSLPVISITGDKLLRIKTDGYENLMGIFYTFDGIDFSIDIYGGKKNGSGGLDLIPKTDDFDYEGAKSFSYPCAFGNIYWKVDISGTPTASDRYILTPYLVRIDGKKYISYRWSLDQGVAPSVNKPNGAFNPVPPRTALKLSDGSIKQF